jgi:uncharacterized protein YjiK
MMRTLTFSLLIVVSLIAVSGRVSYTGDESLSLTYVDRFDILNEAEGLNEPSGLALSHEKNALWTVSDDTKKIFKIDFKGALHKEQVFEIPDTGLEGIALDPAGAFLYLVNEDENEIIKLNLQTQEVNLRKRLSEMAGYQSVARHFENSPPNKGLEGITWNIDSGTIFVMKEGIPGLLIEVSPDLEVILDHAILSEENGFVDDHTAGDKLDFSGICYDPGRKQFWIVSDKGQCLFLYDWQQDNAIQSLALEYRKNSDYREIKKAEGVAIDPAANRLYVVSDKEARLYIYDILERDVTAADRK